MKKINQAMLTLILVLALVGTAYATVGTVTKTVDYTDIKISLNGELITPVDANGNAVEPFAIEGTTYLPVRAVANALGLDVGWDQDTKTVLLNKPSNTKEVTNDYTASYDARNSGDVGNYYVSILGADVLDMTSGSTAIFVTFSWGNNSGETKSFFTSDLLARAFQDGIELERINTEETYNDNLLNIKSGATYTMQIAFTLRNLTSPIEFEIYDYMNWDEKSVPATAVFEFD